MNVTNILLSTLIGLVAYIGKAFYEKMDKVERDLRQSLIDSSGLKEKVNDHDRRIGNLEQEAYSRDHS